MKSLKIVVDEICGMRYNARRGVLSSTLFRQVLRSVNSRGGIMLSEIRVRENESLESALRRFKRQCARSGVIAEVRKREHYEKPSVKRKKKAEAARKRKY